MKWRLFGGFQKWKLHLKTGRHLGFSFCCPWEFHKHCLNQTLLRPPPSRIKSRSRVQWGFNYTLGLRYPRAHNRKSLLELRTLFNCFMLYLLSSNSFLLWLELTLKMKRDFHRSNYIPLSQHAEKRLSGGWRISGGWVNDVTQRWKSWCASWTCGKQG